MNLKEIVLVVVLLSAALACGSSNEKISRKIVHSHLEIKSSKAVFDSSSLKFSCDSLIFSVVNSGSKVEKILVFNGRKPLDTLVVKPKNLSLGIEKDIIKVDMNFDGYCEFAIPDKKTTKNNGIKHYYYIYDTNSHKFIENKSLPEYIGSLKLDIKNQRLKLYCPGDECFAYYKYSIAKKFELVQGEFKP